MATSNNGQGVSRKFLDSPKPSQLKKRAFLAAYSRCGSLSAAAKRAGVDRRTHYNWLADPVYQEAFQQAVREAGDALEDKLHDLAHDGNVTAAIFLLKGLRPEKYRDQPLVSIDLGDWNGDCSRLSPRQLDGFIEEMTRRVVANKAREGLEASADTRAANSTVDVQPSQVTIDVKEMGRRVAAKESVPGVQHLSTSPTVEQTSQMSEPKPDRPSESNYRGTLRWMR